MAYQENFKKNLIYNLQYIRDLYDKMFPSAKDYIQFLKERINAIDNEEHHITSYENLNETKRYVSQKLFDFEENLEKSREDFFDRDHWKYLSQRDIKIYKDLTEHWLKTKTRRQRRIWNYFVLGVPKNSIAPRLKENTNFVAGTIKNLQKEFLDLIFIHPIT